MGPKGGRGDTNVLLSGVFFGGVPGRILDSWKTGGVEFVLSPEILEEYRRSGEELETEYRDLGFTPILSAVVSRSEIVASSPIGEQVARDKDDDKFLACALVAGVKTVVSGDKDLQALGSWVAYGLYRETSDQVHLPQFFVSRTRRREGARTDRWAGVFT